MSEPHITSVHSSPAKYYCSWHLFSLIYRVVCSQCKSGYVSCNPCSSEVDFIPRHKDLKSNMVTMKRLNAYSYYRFEVSWFMIVVYWFFLSFLILPHWTVQLSISTSTAGWWVSLSVASFDFTKGRTRIGYTAAAHPYGLLSPQNLSTTRHSIPTYNSSTVAQTIMKQLYYHKFEIQNSTVYMCFRYMLRMV